MNRRLGKHSRLGRLLADKSFRGLKPACRQAGALKAMEVFLLVTNKAPVYPTTGVDNPVFL